MSHPKRAVRQTELDVTRGLAVLLVVYAHALVMYMPQNAAPSELAFVQWRFLATFGMPVFFTLSGLVYRVKSNRKAFVGALTFLFMAYACHVAGWVLGSVLEGQFSLTALILPLLKHSGLLPVAIWFIVVTAFVQLIYHFVERASLPQRLLIFGVVGGLFVLARVIDRNYFYIGALAPGLLCVASGHALAKSGWLDKRARSPWLGWLAVIALMTVVAVLTPLNLGCEFDPTSACVMDNGRFSVSFLDGRTGFVPLFLVTAATGCCAFWLLGQQLARNAWFAGWLGRLGRNSLALYTLNAFVLSYAQPLIETLLPADAKVWLIVVLPVALTWLQLLVMQSWRRVNDALLRSAGRLAVATVDRLNAPGGRTVAKRATPPRERASVSGSSLD